MLVVTPLSPPAAAYFLGCATPGRWVGGGPPALDLAGPVEGRSLRRVLAGRHPTTGADLLLRRPAHRRAGWDLTFAAPKSLSLLAALCGGTPASALLDAHGAAVGDALDWVVRHGARVRRAGRLEEPAGALAARWEHRDSDGGDPHVHSHVLLVNLAPTASGGWSPLASSPLWPALRPLGGIYRQALRHRLAEAGMVFDWRPVGDRAAAGLFEVAGVPPAAVAAASSRRHRVASTLAAWDDPELAGRPARRAVRASSRGQGVDGPVGGGWEERVRLGGLDRASAELVCALAGQRPRPPAPPASDLAERVTDWLRQRSTSFTGFDVARAVVATHEAGLHPDSLDRWVAGFCSDRAPYQPGRRWTTLAADRDVASVVKAARSRPVPRQVPGGAGAPGASGAASGIDGPGGRGGVTVLAGEAGRSTLVEQAAALAAERRVWEAAGLRVALLAPQVTWRRWDALAGLRPAAGGGHAGLLVVDRADRRQTAELAFIVQQAVAAGTRVVLVEGGTLPARRHAASGALAELRAGAGVAPMAPGPAGAVAVPAPGGVPLVVGAGPHDAIAALVERWAAPAPDRRPVLVGLGPAEVQALNAAARATVVAEGRLDGPSLRAAGRSYQAGDRVMALRRLGVPAGTYGTVTQVQPGGAQMLVAWPSGVGLLDRHEARRLGHGYAAVPSRLPPGAREVLLLGDARTVRTLPARVAGAALVAPTTRRRKEPPLGLLADRLGPPDLAAAARAASRDGASLEAERRRLAAGLLAATPPPAGASADRSPAWWEHHRHDLRAWQVVDEALALRSDALARARDLGREVGRAVDRAPPARGDGPARRAAREPDLGIGLG